SGYRSEELQTDTEHLFHVFYRVGRCENDDAILGLDPHIAVRTDDLPVTIDRADSQAFRQVEIAQRRADERGCFQSLGFDQFGHVAINAIDRTDAASPDMLEDLRDRD